MINVDIQTDVVIKRSTIELGVTHNVPRLNWGTAQAKQSAEALLRDGCKKQNVHIMGWGVLNPNPAPGEYNWNGLDGSVEMIRRMNGEIVITLAACPDWMKGGQPGETDWSKIETAPLPEMHQEFADLCAVVAQRYPDCQYFQVWNEMKGMWSPALNNWDYERYTDLYNKVYTAIKAVRPDAKIGGLYMVIEGDDWDHSKWWGVAPISNRNNVVIDYWLENKVGADFICIDRGILKAFQNPNTYTRDELASKIPWFASILAEVQEKTDLPIWWSEYYVNKLASGIGWNIASGNASLYYHMIMSATNDMVALLWNPNGGETGIHHSLFYDVTGTQTPGEPTPHYEVFKAINDHFGDGTDLAATYSDSSSLKVLATAEKVMLINEIDQAVSVNVCGTVYDLEAYEVRIIATPANLVRNSSFESDLAFWAHHAGVGIGAEARSGEKSLMVLGDGFRWFDQTVTVSDGGEYSLGLHSKLSGDYTTCALQWWVNDVWAGSVPVSSGDWAVSSLAITLAMGDRLKFGIAVRGNEGFVGYFDDFFLRPADA